MDGWVIWAVNSQMLFSTNPKFVAIVEQACHISVVLQHKPVLTDGYRNGDQCHPVWIEKDLTLLRYVVKLNWKTTSVLQPVFFRWSRVSRSPSPCITERTLAINWTGDIHGPDVLASTQPTVSKQWRKHLTNGLASTFLRPPPDSR